MKLYFATIFTLLSVLSVESMGAAPAGKSPAIEESWCTSGPLGRTLISADPRQRIPLDDEKVQPTRAPYYCVSISTSGKFAAFFKNPNSNEYDQTGHYAGGTEIGFGYLTVAPRLIKSEQLQDNYTLYSIALDGDVDTPRIAINIIYDSVRKKWTDQATLSVANSDFYTWGLYDQEARSRYSAQGKALDKRVDDLVTTEIRIVRNIRHEYEPLK